MNPSIDLNNRADKNELVDELADRLLQRPEFRNQMNAERPIQSRVVVGSSMGVIGAMTVIVMQVSGNPFLQYDWDIMGPALLIAWGAVYALYGRLKTGLKPLFTRFLD